MFDVSVDDLIEESTKEKEVKFVAALAEKWEEVLHCIFSCNNRTNCSKLLFILMFYYLL
jgi:hypothetical protein